MIGLFKKLIVLFLVFSIALLLCCAKTSEKKDSKSEESRTAGPNFDFALPDLSGKIFRLKDFKGRVFVINFWATWCPTCEEEIPKLNELSERYKNEGLVVIGIALDKDSLNLVEPFVQKKGIVYPILKGDEQVLLGLENFSGMPTTLIVDQKGNIKKKYDGSFDKDDLEKNLKKLLR
jgi:thiol-disulfide isomerase/thioredoxin